MVIPVSTLYPALCPSHRFEIGAWGGSDRLDCVWVVALRVHARTLDYLWLRWERCRQ